MRVEVAIIVLLLIFLVLLALALYERRASRRAYERYSPPGRRVDIGGHRLYLHCMGERVPGRPTVIFEAGHGDWSRVWRKVMPEIAALTRVCAYDRAGMGWSDPGPHPRTPERVVDELHRLLAAAGESPPYVLVGHSMGGPISRLFTKTYPGEVTGLVWVDTAHEELGQYFPFWRRAYRAFVSMAWAAGYLARLGLVRLAGRNAIRAALSSEDLDNDPGPMIAQIAPSTFFETVLSETENMMSPGAWKGAPEPLGSLPVISIEAQYPGGLPKRYPPQMWDQFRSGWQALQQDLAGLSIDTTRITAATGHVVMNEQPQVVIDAVRTMVLKVSTNSHLAEGDTP